MEVTGVAHFPNSNRSNSVTDKTSARYVHSFHPIVRTHDGSCVPRARGVRTTAEGPWPHLLRPAWLRQRWDSIRSYSDTDRASGGSFSFILPFFRHKFPGHKNSHDKSCDSSPILLTSAGKQRHRRLLLQVLQGPARPGGGQRQQ